MSKEASLTDGVNCLRAKAADGIFTALERQLSVVSFFTDKESDSDLIAPLTNLGCESNFSGFGNDCKESGGATKLETISNKAVIAKNQLYAKEPLTSLPGGDRRKKFRWARGSKEAKEVKRMEEEFWKKIDAVSELATKAKKAEKIR